MKCRSCTDIIVLQHMINRVTVVHVILNLFKHVELREAVVDRLKVGWPPEQIAGV